MKSKIKVRFYKTLSAYYDEKCCRRQSNTFHSEEFYLSINAHGIRKSSHKVSFLTNNLQTKLQIKNMNENYFDLYYIVFKNMLEKENKEKCEISSDLFQALYPI